jgi:NAD(P)-dependent dehydrogenase (short-subunit alcohol dehydrogenase family)
VTRSARIPDYAAHGIRVNVICPGVTLTEMAQAWYESRGRFGEPEKREHASRAPLARHATPAEVAEAAAWLLSPRSSYATGSGLAVDGSWTAA